MRDGSPDEALPFERLDFLYMPSGDVAADVDYFTSVLGAQLVFAIEAFGTRVAMVKLSSEPPDLLLAGHLGGERPVLVYRVASLDRAMDELEARGWSREPVLGIPQGPICSFRAPGGHRIAIYELTRPGAAEHLAGRRDF
jgi:catechol 2,3-dioxygenase-like lactoylglutathione lyase family enzyme